MDRRTMTASLWDAEDTDEAVKVRDMHVAPASAHDVREFTSRYHYTHSAGNLAWRWGLWHGVTLMGVVAYNIPTRSVCASVFGAEHEAHVWHMSRLALPDSAPHNSESRLIGGSLRAIRQEFPDVWAVLTYAATDVGHLGYVYQATNALYTGTGGDSTFYTDDHGRRRSTYITSRGSDGIMRGRGIGRREAGELGWEIHDSLPKHRYLYVLGNKTQRRERMKLLRLPTLPYPKESTAQVEPA